MGKSDRRFSATWRSNPGAPDRAAAFQPANVAHSPFGDYGNMPRRLADHAAEVFPHRLVPEVAYGPVAAER